MLNINNDINNGGAKYYFPQKQPTDGIQEKYSQKVISLLWTGWLQIGDVVMQIQK